MDNSEMLNNIDKLLGLKSIPSQSIPSPLVLGASARSGLSTTRIYNNVIKMYKKLGVPVTDLPDGSPNITTIMTYVIIEEILKDIKENAKIQVAIEPLGNVSSVGVDATGTPVTTNGFITDILTGGAVIS